MNSQSGQRLSQIPRATPEQDDEIDLLKLLGTVWRGKWVIAGCAAGALLIGGYYAYGIAVPKYAARTTLALNLRNEQVVDLESVISGVSTETSAMNTELEVIRSRGLLEELVRDLNLTEDPEFNAALRAEPAVSLARLKALIRPWVLPASDTEPQFTVEPGDEVVIDGALLRTANALRDAITANVQRNTYIFEIAAKTEQPLKSTRIVNRLAELYIADQIEVKFQAIENAVSWLSARSVELEAELREKEDRLKALRAQSDLVNAEGLEALSQQVRELRDRIATTEVQLADQRTALVAARSALADGARDTLAAQLNDPTLTRLLSSDGAETTALFDDRAAVLVARIETTVDRTEQQLVALEASYERLQEQLSTQGGNVVQLVQLQREIEATRTLYETFLARLKETTVQRGLQQADSRILSRAGPGTYVEPRKARILALSLILGLMLGAGIVLLRQFLHRGFRTADELEMATGLAVFGQVPRIPISRRNDLIGYLRDKPTSAAAEAIRNLRTSVLLSNVDAPPQVVMSTSSIPGEGKTTQAIALAQNFSGLGKRVLLIEGDIRRRTFNQYFTDTAQSSLLDVLNGAVSLEVAVQRDERLGADVLMGGKSTVNAADVFSSDRFAQLLAEARKAYDYVIIDTPPVLVVPDARVIAQLVDAIIYSVNWNKTPRDQVLDGLRELQSVNARTSGLVLSQIDPAGMKRYGYGGKYGAYSKYGRSYYEA